MPRSLVRVKTSTESPEGVTPKSVRSTSADEVDVGTDGDFGSEHEVRRKMAVAKVVMI
jgi:hypothetical protein